VLNVWDWWSGFSLLHEPLGTCAVPLVDWCLTAHASDAPDDLPATWAAGKALVTDRLTATGHRPYECQFHRAQVHRY
jgi:hypothetical protein